MRIRKLRQARPPISIYRRTAVLMEATPGGGAVAAQPSVPAYVEVQVDGACSVDVVGVSGGVSTVTTLTFGRAGMKRTVQKFESVATVTTSSAVQVIARSVGADGSRVDNSVLLAEVIAHFDWSGGDWHKRAQGSTGTSSPWYGIDWSADVTYRRGDIIHDGTMRYEVKKADLAYGSAGPHHWELHVEEAHGID